MQPSPSLPLGAVRADDGSVVVPESRRADGSVRKPIRIRQGYVPQDEVPKYKPMGQRMREQHAKEQPQRNANGNGAVEDRGSAASVAAPRGDRGRGSVSAVADDLNALSLGSSSASSTEKKAPPPPVAVEKRSAQPQARKQAPPRPISPSSPPAATTKELKSELSTLNKSLREIGKLETFDAAFARGDAGARPLTASQKRKVERRAPLETRRRALVAQLDQVDEDEEVQPRTLRVIEM